MLNVEERRGEVFLVCQEVGGWIDGSLGKRLDAVAGDRVEGLDELDLVVPERDAVAEVGEGGEYVDGVALDAETSVDEFDFVASVLSVEEPQEQGVAGDAVADMDVDGALGELVGVADAVYA